MKIPRTVINEKRTLWTIYVLIILYALCYQLQRPVEPLLVEYLFRQEEKVRMGQSSNNDLLPEQLARGEIIRTYGRLEAFFSVVQTVGSPLVGAILDKLGARFTFVIVFTSCAMSYGILAHAKSMTMLFISKLPTLFQHAFLVAQAAAASCTSADASSRAEALGRMTTAYTIGSTIGPALGGKIAANGDLYRGAYLAVLGSILCIWISWFNLSNHSQKPKAFQSPSPSRDHRFRSIQDILAKKHLWPYLGAKFFSGVAASMYQTTLPLALMQNLSFNSSLLGLSMSCSSATVALFSAFFLGSLTSKLGTSNMMLSGLMGRVVFISFVSLAVTLTDVGVSITFSSWRPTFSSWRPTLAVLASVFYSIFSHILATSMTTVTTGMVDSSEQGMLLGIEHGLFSIARIVGPPLGAYLFTADSGSFWAITFSCMIIDGYLLYFFLARPSSAFTAHKT